MKITDVVYVAGHAGLVGSALVRRLRGEGFTRIVTCTHAELDLEQQAAVRAFFADVRPSYVFLAAAQVGGIHANDSYPADFIRNNLSIQSNVIDAAYRFGCRKLLLLGSSCIYPKFAAQPISEDALLTGPLEPTNEWYAIAKIAGLKMCQAYRRQYGFDAITLMPTNLYGPGDNFHPENSHLVPALMRRFHEAARSGRDISQVWGSGAPRRELMHVDDLADAAVFLMRTYAKAEPINVGTGVDLTIAEIAQRVANTVGFSGRLVFDASRPDGTPRKMLDVRRLNALGWQARIGLDEGLADAYKWFLSHERELRT